MERTGLLIAIEGSDGSGKFTQFELLRDRLRAAGYDVETFDFPRYGLPSAYFVECYLNGDYGTAGEVGPYTSSLFFALDRFEAGPAIQAALDAGKIVLANRYSGSSMAHQGARFAHPEERRGFFIWLDNLEYQLLRVPRPDKSIVLRVPAAMSQKLVDQKSHRRYTDRKRDIHEADLNHLEQAVASYDDLCQLFPKDFERLDAVRSGQLLDIDTVHKMIWEKVEPMLPAPSARKSAPARQLPTHFNYQMPEGLSKEAIVFYNEQMLVLVDTYRQIAEKLNQYLVSHPEEYDMAESAMRRILPVAAANVRLPEPDNKALAELAHKELPSELAAETPAVQLTSVTPRNELDLVADILYDNSNQPLRAIQRAADKWPYVRKAKVLEAVTPGASVLDQVRYSWDLVTSFDTCQAVQDSHMAASLQWQPLTPRYGYAVPKIIDAADVVDLFEACFDLSLALYSHLQSLGFEYQAQYTTLMGHKTRWSMSHTLAAFKNNESRLPHVLAKLLQEKLVETHPLITSVSLRDLTQ